jgi:hypothetical protein
MQMTGLIESRRALAGVLMGGVLALVVVAGCSSSNETSPTTTTTTTSKKSFEVTTADGQVSVSLDGRLPPNWPASFPLPQGATPVGSGSLGSSSTTAMVGVFNTGGSPEDAYSFYASQAGLAVESQSSIGGGQAYVGTVKFGGSPSGRVTIVPKDGQTLLIITLETAATGSSGTQPTGTTGGTATTGGTTTGGTATE